MGVAELSWFGFLIGHKGVIPKRLSYVEIARKNGGGLITDEGH